MTARAKRVVWTVPGAAADRRPGSGGFNGFLPTSSLFSDREGCRSRGYERKGTAD